MVLYGTCMYYHEDAALDLRRLINNPTVANQEEIQMIRAEHENIVFLDRLMKFFPPKPSKQEIESDEREIFTYKKKNGIPVITALKRYDVINA